MFKSFTSQTANTDPINIFADAGRYIATLTDTCFTSYKVFNAGEYVTKIIVDDYSSRQLYLTSNLALYYQMLFSKQLFSLKHILESEKIAFNMFIPAMNYDQYYIPLIHNRATQC